MGREDDSDFLAPREMLSEEKFALDKDSCIESCNTVKAFGGLPTSWDGLERDYFGQFPYRIYPEVSSCCILSHFVSTLIPIRRSMRLGSSTMSFN